MTDTADAQNPLAGVLNADQIDALVNAAEDLGEGRHGVEELLSRMTQAVLERALETEISDHLGYEPGDPAGVGSLSDARAFMDEFRDRYNHEHHHSGLGLHTPAEVHYGLAAAKAARADVLNTARAAHPERFSTPDAVPKILALPDAAWINNPANRDDQQTYQPAA